MPVITPDPDSRLEQLVAQYDTVKDAADAAAERLKTLVDAIKAEATADDAVMQAALADIESPDLRKPLHLSYVQSWRLDAKRMKKEVPETYVRYAKQTGAWKLERAR